MQNKIASRYAKALYGSMQSAKEEDVNLCAESLHVLATIYEDNAIVKEVFSCPTISKEEKEGLLLEFLKRMKVSLPILESFIPILINSGRISHIKSIAYMYQMLLDKKKGIKRGVVSVVSLFDNAVKDIISDFVVKQFTDTVLLTYKVEPSLLGGFVLQVEDTVYDLSLKTQLTKLKENIKKGV